MTPEKTFQLLFLNAEQVQKDMAMNNQVLNSTRLRNRKIHCGEHNLKYDILVILLLRDIINDA